MVSSDRVSEINTITQRMLYDLEQPYRELMAFSINPTMDYSAQGNFALFRAIMDSRRIDDRASSIYADAISHRGWIHALAKEAEDIYQLAYDAVISNEGSRIDKHYSWDERASLYRTKLIDLEISIREIRRTVLVFDELVESMKVKTTGLGRAQYALDAISKTLQFAKVLGEV